MTLVASKCSTGCGKQSVMTTKEMVVVSKKTCVGQKRYRRTVKNRWCVSKKTGATVCEKG